MRLILMQVQMIVVDRRVDLIGMMELRKNFDLYESMMFLLNYYL